MKEFIERLKTEVSYMEKNHEEMNGISWGAEEGLLISGNEAKEIISIQEDNERLNNSLGLAENECEGLRTTIDRMLVDKEQSSARSKEWTQKQQARIKELEELTEDGITKIRE